MARTNPLDAFVGKKDSATELKLSPLPKLNEFIKGNGLVSGAAKFDEAMEQWRQNTQRMLPQIISSAITEATTAVATTPTVTVATPSPTPAIPNQTALDLAAHIAATVVHGRMSNVVGETDAQPLEKKTIGLANPRYGRFKNLIGGNTVSSGDNVTVPAGYCMIVTPSLSVNGSLTVDGTVLVLP